MTLVESERHQRPLFQGNLQPIASPRPRAAPPDWATDPVRIPETVAVTRAEHTARG